MIYARVHDRTVVDDYYLVMERVEQGLQIALPTTATEERNENELLNDDERGQLLALADQLAAPDLSSEARMELVERVRQVLNHNALPEEDEPPQQENGLVGTPRVPCGCLSRLLCARPELLILNAAACSVAVAATSVVCRDRLFLLST